ncbi:MAG: YihY/virulence factor BrkB family protein [Bdellovibrionales bacterium]
MKNLRLLWNSSTGKILRKSLAHLGERFFELETIRLAASLSFYVLLSFAPIVLLYIDLVGNLDASLVTRLGDAIESLGSQAGVEIFWKVVAYSQENSVTAGFGGLGVLTLLITASLTFSELRAALDLIFQIGDAEAHQISFLSLVGQYVQTKLASVTLVLGFITLLSVTLIGSSFLRLPGRLDFQGVAFWINAIIGWSVYFVAFTLMLRFAPSKPQPWKVCWQGGLVIASLFTVGKEAIGIYIAEVAIGAPFGALGSAAVFMIWVYYSSLIILVGAEIVRVLAQASRQKPNHRSAGALAPKTSTQCNHPKRPCPPPVSP